MMSQPILGIDIAKDTFAVALLLEQQPVTAQFANSTAGFHLLQTWWQERGVTQVHACLEATGTYGLALALFLQHQGQLVSVVNPLRIKGYAQAQLKRHKTDQADARLIAAFCATQKPALWRPPAAQVAHLQALTRRIEALQEMLQAEQNRLAVAPAAAQPSVTRIIATLGEEIRRLETEIQAYIDDDPDLREQSRLLQSIPGIGAKTAHLLLSEIEFAHYQNARQVAAHAGLIPHQEQSGSSIKHTKLSKLGNGRIRKALYFPAVSAKRYNAPLREFAQRLEQRGKTKMQIICAVMRKLLHQAYGILKHRTPFSEQPTFST